MLNVEILTKRIDLFAVIPDESCRKKNYFKTFETSVKNMHNHIHFQTEVVTVLRRYLGATKHYNGITNAKEVGNVDMKTRIEKQLVPLFHPHGKLFGIIKNILANSLTAPAKSLASLICAIFLLGGGKSEAIKKSLIYFMTNSKVQPIVVLELLHEITQVF